MRVNACVRVYIGRSGPPLEVGATTLGSGTPCGEDDVGVAVRSVLTVCRRFLDSQATLGDGASVGAGMDTYLGYCSDQARQCSNIWRTP